MIYYWIALGLILATSLFILATALLIRKKFLLLHGGWLVLASILLIVYYSNLTADWMYKTWTLAIIVWLFFVLYKTFIELKLLVKNNHDKSEQKKDLHNKVRVPVEDIDKPVIALKSGCILLIKDICYIKSDGPYVEYYLCDRKNPEIDRNTLKNVYSFLLNHNFVQIYRSVIINKNYLAEVNNNKVYLKDGVALPLSTNYRYAVE